MIDKTIEINPQIARVPFKCVVCNGFGTLTHQRTICHACQGRGFIVIDQEREIDTLKENYARKIRD